MVLIVMVWFLGVRGIGFGRRHWWVDWHCGVFRFSCRYSVAVWLGKHLGLDFLEGDVIMLVLDCLVSEFLMVVACRMISGM